MWRVVLLNRPGRHLRPVELLLRQMRIRNIPTVISLRKCAVSDSSGVGTTYILLMLMLLLMLARIRRLLLHVRVRLGPHLGVHLRMWLRECSRLGVHLPRLCMRMRLNLHLLHLHLQLGINLRVLQLLMNL